MRTVTSKDGTTLAFDQLGKGSPLILVDGAFQHRAIDPQTAQLAKLLAPHFTVFHYDRRGRGDSGDTLPYAVEREVEDLEALITAAGGSAFVYGMSSGAALALEAAIQCGDLIKKLAMYEAPYNDDDNARQAWREYRQQLSELLAANRRGDAVILFMRLLGMPAEHAAGMHQQPIWPTFEAVAPTLAYDAAIMGGDASVPIERAARVDVPTLIMDGGASEWSFMHTTAVALAQVIPNAQHRTLEGQTHDVAPDVLAPVLIEFFKD